MAQKLITLRMGMEIDGMRVQAAKLITDHRDEIQSELERVFEEARAQLPVMIEAQVTGAIRTELQTLTANVVRSVLRESEGVIRDVVLNAIAKIAVGEDA